MSDPDALPALKLPISPQDLERNAGERTSLELVTTLWPAIQRDIEGLPAAGAPAVALNERVVGWARAGISVVAFVLARHYATIGERVRARDVSWLEAEAEASLAFSGLQRCFFIPLAALGGFRIDAVLDAVETWLVRIWKYHCDGLPASEALPELSALAATGRRVIFREQARRLPDNADWTASVAPLVDRVVASPDFRETVRSLAVHRRARDLRARLGFPDLERALEGELVEELLSETGPHRGYQTPNKNGRPRSTEKAPARVVSAGNTDILKRLRGKRNRERRVLAGKRQPADVLDELAAPPATSDAERRIALLRGEALAAAVRGLPDRIDRAIVRTYLEGIRRDGGGGPSDATIAQELYRNKITRRREKNGRRKIAYRLSRSAIQRRRTAAFEYLGAIH